MCFTLTPNTQTPACCASPSYACARDGVTFKEELSHSLKGILFVPLIRRIALLAFLMGATSGFVFAQFPMPTQRPQEDLTGAQVREVVSKYCRLDYEGARLDPQMWPEFQPLVWWHSAPETSKINVIARYTVDADPVENHGKFSVTVHDPVRRERSIRPSGTFAKATAQSRMCTSA